MAQGDTLDLHSLHQSQPEPGRPDSHANYPDAADEARAKIASFGAIDHANGEDRVPEDGGQRAASELNQVSVLSPQSSALGPQSSDHSSVVHPQSSAKKLPSRLRPVINAVLTFVLLMAIFKSGVLLSQLQYLTHKPDAPKTAIAPAVETVSSDPTITIPKINVNAPVVYIDSNAEAAIQKGLEGGVVHYSGTALPGQKGNSVIVGHSSNDWWEPGNFKFVFVLLDKVAVGDNFSINFQGKKYVYEVTETKIVKPDNLSVLEPTPEPTVTLITCDPPGTSINRLIVKAKQISPAPNTAVAATTGGGSADTKLPGNATGFGQQFQDAWHSFVQTVVSIFKGPGGSDSQPQPSTLPSAT